MKLYQNIINFFTFETKVIERVAADKFLDLIRGTKYKKEKNYIVERNTCIKHDHMYQDKKLFSNILKSHRRYVSQFPATLFSCVREAFH